MKNVKQQKQQTTEAHNNLLPIVGIGASAGGLNALKVFFKNVSENSGLAYVVVVHLSPEHKSVLAELLQPHVNMPVNQVKNSSELKANHVYVIPPNANLNTIDTHLRLSKLERERGARAPIDHFFRTLAKTHKGSSIGVILTGTGSDGTLGLKEIKAEGGLTVVQDPIEAEYDGMPQSALSTDLVDMVLPIKEIPAYLQRYISTKPQLKAAKSEDEYDEEELKLLHKVFAQIRARTRRDFGNYKLSTLVRRLQRRMQIYQIEKLQDYLNLLRNNPEEVKTLSDDFLINVTSFFRDQEHFQYLADEVLPQILMSKKPDEQLRIWSVGCATGEEAYSLAILYSEVAQELDISLPVQVFASDLHENALYKAREGFFPGDIKADVSKERLEKYFIKEDGGFRISKELREMVIFTPHNLLGDPPFSKIDLVVCRNLLIYLKKNVQRDVFELFHYALQSKGFLMLGSSESLESAELFSTVKKEFSLYRKKNVSGLEPRLPVFPTTQAHYIRHKPGHKEEDIISFGELHHKLIEHFGPPSLLLDQDYQVLHVSETAGRYLKISGGELSRDIFKLIKPELMLELRSTIYAAKENDVMSRSRPVMLRIEGQEHKIFISSRIIQEQDNNSVILIMFEEYEENAETKSSNSNSSGKTHLAHVEELERELRDTRQRLQAVIEEYETSREEMKASNEELQSANEELRSTLEELETSKEELQSMNEELITLNQENRHKVEELRSLSDDLQNLMAATDIATLFLTRDLRILRYTPQLGALFNVKSADKGRKISDLTNKLGYDNLVKDAGKVLSNLQPIEHEIKDEKGSTYFARLLPYRSAEDKIDGVVITFVDISRLKFAESEQRKSQEKYKALFETIDAGFSIVEVLYDKDEHPVDCQFLETNPAFKSLSGLKNPEGKKMKNLIEGDDEYWYEVYGRVAKSGKSERFEKYAAFLGERWFEVNVFKVGDKHSNKVAVLYTDINDYKKQTSELKRAKDEAERAARIKEDFLAHMSHEIRTPINALLGISHLLLNKSPKAAQKENLLTLKLATDNLSSLVNDVLDFSKIQAGKVKMEARKVKLREFLKEVVDIHENGARDKNLSLRCEVDEAVPPFIETDPSKLSHALHNIISNAIKFTHKGKIEIEVTLQQKEMDNLMLMFSVTDTGIGISKNKHKEIFDVFCQADNSTVREYGGTGLGLAITKLYLEMMDSDIHVESKEGEGSKFYFELPVKATEEEMTEIQEEEIDIDLKRYKFLLAEDDEYNREIMIQLFNMWDVSLDAVENGHEALRAAKEMDYDIILMDVRMPVMDGYEATKKIRKLEGYKDKPVIALTADLSKKVKEQHRPEMFNDILLKPVDPKNLRQKIAEVLSKEA